MLDKIVLLCYVMLEKLDNKVPSAEVRKLVDVRLRGFYVYKGARAVRSSGRSKLQ